MTNQFQLILLGAKGYGKSTPRCELVEQIADYLCKSLADYQAENVNKCDQADKQKLLIIDGTNLLCQMFFGMPARITGKDGKPIHGILGFVGALIRIIKMTSPTHLVVLFDGEHENHRTEIYADYKTNRPDYIDVSEEENPFSQLADIYTALDFMSIKHAEINDGEADDAIASYALTYGGNTQIVISSFDSDFFQLVTHNVSVLRYRGENTIICDDAYIQQKLGVSARLYADFKSLTGDNSDNIKGAEKVGPKTAAALVNDFGSLQDILKNADHIVKPSVRESVKRNFERLITNYSLIKLDNKSALPYCINDLKYCYDGISTNEVLQKIGLR